MNYNMGQTIRPLNKSCVRSHKWEKFIRPAAHDDYIIKHVHNNSRKNVLKMKYAACRFYKWTASKSLRHPAIIPNYSRNISLLMHLSNFHGFRSNTNKTLSILNCGIYPKNRIVLLSLLLKSSRELSVFLVPMNSSTFLIELQRRSMLLGALQSTL